jgi:hypothetical protein
VRNKTDRGGWSLRGPVHICQISRTWYSRQCGADTCETEERSEITNLEFLASGSLAKRFHHNPDGSEWTTTYNYDDTGKLTARGSENSAGPVDVQSCEYSTAGQLVRVIARPNGNGDRITESYDYDTAGRKMKTVYIDLPALRPDTHYLMGVEGSDSSYGAPGAATVTTMYNQREQPIDLHFYDEAGRLLSRVEFKYDRDANLVEEAQTKSGEMFSGTFAGMNEAQLETVRALLGAGGEPITRMHRYDELGRRVETRSRIDPLSEDKTTRAYNDHGDQIEEISEHNQRDYGIDDDGRLSDSPTSERLTRSEACFRYDYDAFGNWVTKTIESRAGMDKDFTVSSLERRTIGYFE